MSTATLDQVLTQRREAQREIVNVDEPTEKLVIFVLGNEWFAFPGRQIREILAAAEVFFVPGCPPSLDGVINVRGDIESVVRIDALLGLKRDAAASAAILLGHGGGLHSGIRVDRVVDVVDVPQSLIQTPPATLDATMRSYVSGVLRFSGQPVAVLDLDKIFADYARGLG